MAKRTFVKSTLNPKAASLTAPYSPTVNPLDYVRPVSQPNVVINGQMDIWQKGTSFTGLGNSANQLGADRFRFQMTTTNGTPAVASYTQVTDVPTFQQVGAILNYSAQIKFTTAAGGVAVADYARIYYPIEGYDYRQLIGAPITISFWVKSSIAGTFGLTVAANAATSYLAEYQISNTGTWERKVITVPSPQPTAAFNFTNGVGLYVEWFISAGSAGAGGFTVGTANIWAPIYTYSANQNTTHMTTLNSTFQLAGVKIEPGPIATPILPVYYEDELRHCQRYLEVISGPTNTPMGSGFSNSTSNARFWVPFKTTKRAAPTVTLSAVADVNVLRQGGVQLNGAAGTASELISVNGTGISVITAASQVAGEGVNLLFTNTTATITADAEL